jgi:ATP-dependent RNA helicase RhlE
VTPTSFSTLGVAEPICRALKAEGYDVPTPIQTSAIPHLLAGSDLLGIAQTGTGKTAAFALPILQRLAANQVRPAPKSARVLVLTPTRELAAQIGDSFRTYGRHLGLKQTVVFGGVGQHPQVQALLRGVDILIATPGRLLDLLNQRHVRLDLVETFVLDEADRMLDMGFIRDVRKVIAVLPKRRQTQLFSATMPSDISRLAGEILHDPIRVEVTPSATTVEQVQQRVYFVDASQKRTLLAEVLKDPALARVIVFTRTKHGANRVAEQLAHGGVVADAIHSNKSQTARQRALEGFRNGRARVLVATDIAARGIDIDGVTHVINFEVPNVPESYVHRIGRTARAGASGTALSFCAPDERGYLRDIERLTGRPCAVIEHRFRSIKPTAPNHPPRTGRDHPPRTGRDHPPRTGRNRRRSGQYSAQPQL